MSSTPPLDVALAAVRSHPKNPFNWLDLGNALVASGDKVKAKDCYERAIAIDPDFDAAKAALKALSEPSAAPLPGWLQGAEAPVEAAPPPPPYQQTQHQQPYTPPPPRFPPSTDPNRIVCQNCGYASSKNRTTCKQCKQPLPGHEAAVSAPRKKSAWMGAPLLLLLICGVCGGLYVVSPPEPSTPSESDSSSGEAGAEVACQRYVRDQLRSPDSADFPWPGTAAVVIDNTEGKFIVNSYVDAQNGFGAEVRTNYHCVVEYRGFADYELIQLDMLD